MWLIAIAGLLWILSAFLFFSIKEEKGDIKESRSTLEELKEGIRIFKADQNLRLFLTVRVLLMSIPLAQPFIVIFGRNQINLGFDALGVFVIISRISAFISSPFWGRFSEKNSRKMIFVISMIGIFILLFVIIYPLIPQVYQNVWTFSPALFLISIAHGGARLSRKTYLIDYAPEDRRPLYISLSNTFIGIFTIVSG